MQKLIRFIYQLIKRYPWVFYSLFALLVFGQFSGSYPITILDEAKNSEAAREMLQNGEWFFPKFNGEIRTDKPPLHYFFIALGYLLFGVGPLGARLFSAVFGALTFYLIVVETARNISARTAVFTGIVFISSLLFAQEFHMSVPDPYLIFFITATLVFFHRFDVSKAEKNLLFAYVFLGLGLLTKGPVAAVVVVIAAGLYFTFNRSWSFQNIRSFHPIKGALLALFIALPWYVLAHIETDGAFTEGFFLDHNLHRFSDQKEGHGGPFIITPLLVILGLLPFGIWGIPAVIDAFKRKAGSTWLSLCLSVSIGVISFFSLSSTKLPNYPMPAFGFLAVVIGVYLDRLSAENRKRPIVIGLWVLLLVSLALTVGVYFGLKSHAALFNMSYLAYWVAVLPLSAFTALIVIRRFSIDKIIGVIAFGWMLFGSFLWSYLFNQISMYSPVAKTSEFIEADGVVTIVYQRMDAAFPIQLQRTFDKVSNRSELLNKVSAFNDVLVLTNSKSREEIEWLSSNFELLVEAPALFEDHTTRLFRVTRGDRQAQSPE